MFGLANSFMTRLFSQPPNQSPRNEEFTKKMTESLDYTIVSSSILHREQTFSDLKALLSCNICKLPNYLYLYECGHCVCTLCHRGGRTVSACCGGKARIFGLNGMVRYFGECVKEMDS